MQNHQILVVDDDDAILALMYDALEDDGYNVITINNGLEGLEYAQANLPALILLDVRMPQLDGFEFLQHYYESVSSPAPIIIMSASTSLIDQISAQYPVDALQKPFNVDDLCQLIHSKLR